MITTRENDWLLSFDEGNRGAFNRPNFWLGLNDAGAGAVNLGLNRGNGASTFTRATVAWTKLSTGLWAQVASGVARSGYLGATTAVGAYGGYFSEAAGTQLVTPDASIRDMTGTWVAGATMTVALTGTGIDGVVNSCSRLTAGAVSATNTIFQTLTAAASSRTYSVWLKRVTGTGVINITQDGGLGYTDVTSSLNTLTFTRVSLTASQLNAAFGIQVVTAGDVILADFNQFEAGALATSPMASAGAARNADSLTYTNTGNILGTRGSCYAEHTVAQLTTNPSFISCYDATSIGIPLYIRAATPAYALYDNGVERISALTPTVAATTIVKAASSWGSGVSISAGGAITSSITFSGDMNITNKIGIGCNGSGVDGQTYGTIKNVRIWNRQLPNTILQSITT